MEKRLGTRSWPSIGQAFSLPWRGHFTTLPPRIPCWAVILRLNSVAGFAEPTLSLIGLTPTYPQTLPRGVRLPSFRDQTSGHRETEAAHPLVTGDALPCNPISIGDMQVSSRFSRSTPATCTYDRCTSHGPKTQVVTNQLRPSPSHRALAWQPSCLQGQAREQEEIQRPRGD